VLSTDQKGAVAELAIAYEATKLGVGVYRPVAEGGRYDLIFEIGQRLHRVQCMFAPLHGDVVVVRRCSTRRAREGLRKRKYRASEVDLIAAYCPDLDRYFVLSTDQFADRTQVDLRVAHSKNNQRLGVNWADDFDFGARLTALLGP
jgi:hypothetical protein